MSRSKKTASIMWRSKKLLLSSAVAVFVIASVAAHRGGAHNASLKATSSAGYRFENLPPTAANTNGLFVVLTFSGGGTRAAALAYGVLLELRDTKFVRGGRETSLLEEVDVISSVSGGSFTAAYYGLHHAETFASFERDMLHRNITRELAFGTVRPDRGIALPFTHYNRSDLAADLYDERIFANATFADLQKRGRPFIVINATDLSRGAPFEFTQNHFDLLCSDLSRLRVGASVAASAGFPGLLTPMRLTNYAGQCGYAIPKEVTNAQRDRIRNPQRYLKGNRLRSYLDAKRRPWVHLVDGGVSDNLGLHTIIDALNEDIPEVHVANMLEEGEIQKLVVIAVNAGTDQDDDIDRSASTPGLATVIAKSAYGPIDNVSTHLLDFMRMGLNDLPDDAEGYLVHVNFEAIPPERNPRKFTTLPTTLNLPPETASDVRDMGRLLLRENPGYQRLRKALAASRQAAPPR